MTCDQCGKYTGTGITLGDKCVCPQCSIDASTDTRLAELRQQLSREQEATNALGAMLANAEADRDALRKQNAELEQMRANWQKIAEEEARERDALTVKLAACVEAMNGLLKFARPTRGINCAEECLGKCDDCKALAFAREALANLPATAAKLNAVVEAARAKRNFYSTHNPQNASDMEHLLSLEVDLYSAVDALDAARDGEGTA